MLEQMTFILLPIVLFIINLVVTLILRESDSRKRGLSGVKKLTEQYKAEIDNDLENFRSEVGELENKVAAKDKQLRAIIDDIDKELAKLNSYQDDMANLRQCMDTYRDALAGLAKLTNDADAKTDIIEADVQRLEEVRNMVNTFRLDMKDADEHLKLHENTVIQLQKDTVSQLETFINSYREEAEKMLADTKDSVFRYYDALEEKIGAVKKATEDMQKAGVVLMDSIGDRLNDQHILATQISELRTTRNELASTISDLEKQVQEKKSFASELEEIARAESRRLANIKQEIQDAEIRKPEPVDEQDDEFVEPANNSVDGLINEPVDETAEEPEITSGSETLPVEDEEMIIEDKESEKLEYYGEEEEIVF